MALICSQKGGESYSQSCHCQMILYLAICFIVLPLFEVPGLSLFTLLKLSKC